MKKTSFVAMLLVCVAALSGCSSSSLDGTWKYSSKNNGSTYTFDTKKKTYSLTYSNQKMTPGTYTGAMTLYETSDSINKNITCDKNIYKDLKDVSSNVYYIVLTNKKVKMNSGTTAISVFTKKLLVGIDKKNSQKATIIDTETNVRFVYSKQ